MLTLRLQGYTLAEPLHESSDSTLYRGTRDEDGQPVLAKVLSGEYPSPAQLAQLRHEHAVTRDLGLEGVCEPLELRSLGHGLALVWAAADLSPLRSLLDAGPLELTAALRLAASLATTLADLHERHIIHKNLNPESILVDVQTWRAHLVGFGIASRLSRETPQLSHMGTLEGTLTYFSPEQTGRMNRILDRRSDLYSLGVVLYELLTGAPPFQGRDATELLYSHLARRPVPPRELRPELPQTVSELTMKLLEKNAEDRYQYARGLGHDLRRCLAGLAEGPALPAFPLGSADLCCGAELDIPQRIYGREAELDALMGVWARVHAGATRLLLVRGYSGIGKSVLVRELHRELVGARAYFVSGKFDQLGRAVPYAPLVAAFTELVHVLLTEPEHELERVRAGLLAAVGERAGLLTQWLPDLEQILGTHAALPVVGGTASRNRFVRTVSQLLEVCTATGRPLVLFLDDLQWADLASLELLEALLGGAVEGLLVIGAYRSNEVDAAHPLSVTVEAIQRVATVDTITLGPLARGDVLRFIGEALAMELDAVEPLSRLIYEKTEGNPFFIIQLLVALHKDQLLRYDNRRNAYLWDEAELRAKTQAADNVVAFMSERIRQLSPETRRALELAACIGHRFAIGALATIAESSAQVMAGQLWEALEEGVLVALDPAYRSSRDPGECPSKVASIELRFLHDRVQQAAYATTDQAQRPALHLRIGRLMRRALSLSLSKADPREVSFELVEHLNLGRAHIRDPSERLDLAQLNASCARRARAATAYAAASRYFGAGLSLLDEDSFETRYALSFELTLGAAEAAMLEGVHARARAHLDTLLPQARSAVERAEVLDLRAVLDASQGRSSDAVEAGLEGLSLLEHLAPATAEARRLAYERQLAAVGAILTERGLEALALAPALDAPELRVAMKLARHTALSAFGSATELGYWLTALAAHISLEHGLSDQSASAYALLGAVVASSTTRYAQAHELVTLALAVHERRGGDLHEACMLGFYFATVSHYAMHWRELLPYLERARVAGVESGDHLFLSYTCSHRAIARLLLGDPLDELRGEVERMRAQMQAMGLASAAATQTVTLQTIAALEGRSAGPTRLDGADCDEAALVEAMEAGRMSFALCWYRTVKGMLLYLAGDADAALIHLEAAMAMTPVAFTPETRYFTALALLDASLSADLDSARAGLLTGCRRDLAVAAQACPANYGHRHLLVEAEAARRAGDHALAMERYDQALDAAEEHDWPRDVALANERAGTFYLGRSRLRIARAYMTDAAYGYARWGAVAQVQRLIQRDPDLVPMEAQLSSYRAHDPDEVVDEVDILTFARSLQSVAREVTLDSVIERMMQTVLKSAGAQRVVLILEREGALIVDAELTVDAPRVALSLGTPLHEHPDLPGSFIRYTARMSESAVLDDAVQDDRFNGDPYILQREPRSLACLALTYQGRSRGMLYLENNAVRAAFTSKRLELLELLASQAVISLDNAHLFGALREREGQWRGLVSSAPDFILIVDREHRVEYINKLAYGLQRDAVVGAPLEELMTLETRANVRAGIDSVFETGSTTSYESSMRGPEGLVHFVTRLGPIMRDGEVHRATLISSDVTEQYLLEAQLRQSQKLQAIGTLAGGVAHDFNNLLTVILGTAELCELDVVGNEGALESLSEIIQAAGQAAALTRQLLAFSRKQVLQPQWLDLSVLVHDMLKMLRRLIGENIILEFNGAGQTCPIFVDRGQMEQVVMNLVINARDAMPRGGELAIATARAHADSVSLTVRDTGEGMNDETRQRLFDPFYTTKETGTGLGLSIVLGVVEQSGGCVSVESALGRGTTFELLIPAAAASPTISSLAPPAASLPRGSEVVLVVEDGDAVRSLTSRLLGLQGYEVLSANGGEEAMAIARARPELDLLITDLVMPGLHGREVAAQVTVEHPRAKVLYMSGYTDDTILRDGVVDGSRAFLHKPFTRKQLACAVRNLLDERPRGAALDLRVDR